MYGTVAHFQAKPGMQAQLTDKLHEFEAAKVPGVVGSYIYRMDTDPNSYYIAVMFESKEAYLANAQSPEQDARYQRIRALLDSEPEWHDGEIVYALR